MALQLGLVLWHRLQSRFRRFLHKDELAQPDIYNFGTMKFPADEAPGLSVLANNENRVFHTYSSYGRGFEPLLGVYFLLDRAPKGRDEDSLPYPMAWVRHHDR